MEVTINNCKVVMKDINDIISYKIKLEQEVFDLENLLKEKKERLTQTKKYLMYNCKHTWIKDSIDCMEGYKQDVAITYCDKCELTLTT